MNQEGLPSRMRLNRGTRGVYTFNVLFNGCNYALKLAQEREEGIRYTCMFSMLSAAFAVEAYLNHLGQDRFGKREWKVIGRNMSPEAKLRLLAKLTNYNPDFGRRPCQTFSEIMGYRNRMVHARTETLTFVEGQVYDPTTGPTEPETGWEQATTLETAERFYKDSLELVRQLHEAAGLPEYLLQFGVSGWSEWSGSPVSDGE